MRGGIWKWVLLLIAAALLSLVLTQAELEEESGLTAGQETVQAAGAS